MGNGFKYSRLNSCSGINACLDYVSGHAGLLYPMSPQHAGGQVPCLKECYLPKYCSSCLELKQRCLIDVLD